MECPCGWRGLWPWTASYFRVTTRTIGLPSLGLIPAVEHLRRCLYGTPDCHPLPARAAGTSAPQHAQRFIHLKVPTRENVRIHPQTETVARYVLQHALRFCHTKPAPEMPWGTTRQCWHAIQAISTVMIPHAAPPLTVPYLARTFVVAALRIRPAIDPDLDLFMTARAEHRELRSRGRLWGFLRPLGLPSLLSFFHVFNRLWRAAPEGMGMPTATGD